MQDEKIAFDESRRLHQHGLVKGEIESRVHADIRASSRTPGDVAAEAARIDALAGRLRGKAIDNVAETEDEIERQRRFARLKQFVDYAFGLVYGLLGLRFLLALIDARAGSGFVRFVNTVTAPLYAPFRGILPTPTVEQGYAFSSSVLLAMVVYAMIHFALKGLLRIVGRRSTEL
jgi:uncharacterized protein YggT (Ycf19 family)